MSAFALGELFTEDDLALKTIQAAQLFDRSEKARKELEDYRGLPAEQPSTIPPLTLLEHGPCLAPEKADMIIVLQSGCLPKLVSYLINMVII